MKSIRTRLIFAFLALGLGIVVVLTIANLIVSGSGMARITGSAEEELSAQMSDHMASLATARGNAIEDYFATIEKQIITFSEDRMVVDAMREFRGLFDSYRAERDLTDADIARMKEELWTYYEGQFTPEYRSQNDGTDPQMRQRFEMLDDDSIALQHAYIQDNPNPLGSKEVLDAAGDGTRYSQLHGVVHPPIRNFLYEFGYYDIFLCDPDTGDIIYSVFKELDYSTSLKDGPYANTNFGEAFRMALDLDKADGGGAGRLQALHCPAMRHRPASSPAPCSTATKRWAWPCSRCLLTG